MIRTHIGWAEELEREIEAAPDFELVTPRSFSLLTFRYVPAGVPDEAVDDLNERLLQRVNDDGYLYLTRTNFEGRPVLRFVIGQPGTRSRHVRDGWAHVVELARGLSAA